MSFSVGLDRSALDPSFKAHAGRGIGRYVEELARYLDAQKDGDISVGAFDHSSFVLPGLVDLSLRNLPLGRQTIRQQIFYPMQLRSGKMAHFQALHFPAHMDAPSWSVKPYLLTVLDLIPLIFRDLYEEGRSGFRFRFARWLEINAIRSATLILAISECTARDVTRILGVPSERIVVTPLGVDEKFFRHPTAEELACLRSRLQLNEDTPTILYVGGIDQRKNIRGLLEIFSRVASARRERGASVPRLLLAGRIRDDRGYPSLIAMIKQMGLVDIVSELGFIPDQDLPALYGISEVFLFPSLYEGFGLTPLEALAAGVPVVSSNASAMPEVLGDAALLVGPKEYDKAAALVSAILDNRDLAVRLAAEGPRQAAKFTWQGTGELTLEAYERAAHIIGA